jgi:hypothetical protein
MAEDRLGPEGQNCSHEDTLPIKLRVAYRVHARVRAVKATRCKPALYPSSPKAEVQQLPETHNTMLSAGQYADLLITWM